RHDPFSSPRLEVPRSPVPAQLETQRRPGVKRWLPWVLGAGLVGLVVWRMLYLYGTNSALNGAFFAGAFVRSLQLGSLYALIALGYTMVYGIIRLINFAHGEVFMVGAFTAFLDRKSTRLNSSHVKISYAVFCLKKKV